MFRNSEAHAVPRIFRQQLVLARRLTEAAYVSSPPAINLLLLERMRDVLRGGDVGEFIRDRSTIKAVCAEALGHLGAQRHREALVWGRLAHVVTRRFCHSWLPFIDIIVAADAVPGPTSLAEETAPPGPIPRHLVQFWDEPVPPADVMALIDGWRTSCPEYTHELFDDGMARQFLGDCYGERLLRLYNITGHVAGKSDLFRLAWLALNGGVYVDADERCVGEVGSLLPGSAGLVVNWSPGPPPCVNNWFIASQPCHPAIIAMLTLAAQQIARAAELGSKLSPWILTGPGVFSSVLMDEVAMSDGVPLTLNDMSLQPEERYRKVARTVHDLSYRRETDKNWKLAFR